MKNIKNSSDTPELPNDPDKPKKINPPKDLHKFRELDDTSVEYLKGFIEEFFQTFVVIGYDMDGKRVAINNVKSAKDQDALLILIENFIDDINEINKRMGPDPDND